MRIASYKDQQSELPATGRHILAQYDDESVIVYQAYNSRIGEFAAKHQFFGGDFSMHRMSWIKPNFLWMMFRSGWGTKENQEITLAIRLKRSAFDEILKQSVHSSYEPEAYADEIAWQRAVADSDVRLQWDPDHNPSGAKLERRAIQLGLRGYALSQYARNWIIEIHDVSEFVAQQRANVSSPTELLVPYERAYIPNDDDVSKKLGVSL